MPDVIFNSCVLEQANSTLKVDDENMETLRRKLEELSCQETDINSALNNAELLKGKNPKAEVDDLVQQGRIPERDLIAARADQGGRFITNDSRKLEEVWRCLMSDLVSRIGICGKGGVGRKNLTNHIYNWILECRDPFENVYRVSVCRDCSIQQLQNDIAVAAGLDISDKGDEKRRATLLLKMLRRRKNTLFILDGMRDHFPLKKIGIPTGENGSKLIVASQSQDVCHRLGCQSIIKVDPLPKKEASTPCMEPNPQNEELKSGVKEIAQPIVDECDGLPSAIIARAGAMNNLVQQGRFPEGNMIDAGEVRVFKPTKTDATFFAELSVLSRLKSPQLSFLREM